MTDRNHTLPVFFDIETVPSQQPGARDEVAATIKPPGNYKKAETIAAWLETEAPAAIDEAYRKQSFDGAVGEIVSISFCTDATEPQSFARGPGGDEADMIRTFFSQVDQVMTDNAIKGGMGEVWAPEPYFIAHNASFDLGFLWRRCIVLNIRPPFRLPTPTAREGRDYGCTMERWAGFRERISLDRLCKALSIPTPKTDLDGSKVFDAWLAGEVVRIAEYNRADAAAVRAIWQRLNWSASA